MGLTLTSVAGWLVAILAVLLIYLYRKVTKNYGYLETLGIPVIKPTFCFGSRPWEYHKVKTYEQDQQNYREFKSKTWGYYEGRHPTIVTMDKNLIKEILIKDFDSFKARFMWPVKESKRQLDFTHGEEWKSLRKLISPSFTSGKLKVMVEPISYYVDKMLNYVDNKLTDVGNPKQGIVLDVKTLLDCTTLDIIWKCGFGVEVNTVGERTLNVKSPVLKEAREVFAGLVLPDMFSSVVWVLVSMFPALLQYTPTIPEDAYRRMIQMSKKTIEKRDTADEPDRGDFLDRLRGFRKRVAAAGVRYIDGISEDMVMAQTAIFVTAGYETLSNAMTLLCYNLAKYPKVQDKLLQSVRETVADDEEITSDNVKDLTYLEACVKESLRLYPSVIRNQRVCMKDTVIGGLKIKKNTQIQIPVYAMHRIEEYWGDNAEEFDPDRIASGECEENFNDLTYHAFGAGPRICLGMRFTIEESKVLMAKLVRKFEIILAPGVTGTPNFDKGNPFILSFSNLDLRLKPRK